MSELTLGATTTNLPPTTASAITGAWTDMRTWEECDGKERTEWITEVLCAELYAKAYFGNPPVFDLPSEIRWYDLQKLRVKVTTANEHTKIPGQIRAKVISVQRPFPYQYRPLAYHKQDVVEYLKTLDRTSLINGTWNKLGGDCWTSNDGQGWGTDALINRTRRCPDENRFSDSALYPSELSALGLPVDRNTAKKQKGRVRVLELDWPGGTRPRCKVFNLNDAAEAKKLVVQQDQKRRKKQGAKLKKVMKKNEKKKDDDGKLWFSLRFALKYLNKFFSVSKGTLQKWSRGDCVYLGRPIEVKQFDDGKGYFVDFISKEDLDEIRSEQKKRSRPDAATVSFAEAIKLIGGTENEAAEILRGMPTVEAIGKRKDGRPLTKRRFKRKKVRKIGRKMRAYLAHPTVIDATRGLGTDSRTLKILIERGHLTIVPDPFERMRQRPRRVNKNQVQALKKERETRNKSKDERGTWLPFSVATEFYPNATSKVLYKYANKPCPQLRGKTLRAEHFAVEFQLPQRGAKGSCLKWLEADLKKLEPAKVGKPGQEAAQAARENPVNGQSKPGASGVTGLSESALDRLVEKIVGAVEATGRVTASEIKNEIAAIKGAGLNVTGLSNSALERLVERIVGAVEATGRVTASEIKYEIAAIVSAKPLWSAPNSPKAWAKIFQTGWDTLKKQFENQVYKNEKLSDRSYRVAIEDIPADQHASLAGK